MLKKTSLAKYIESTCGDLSIEQTRTRVSLMYGYYVGFSMSVERGEGVDDSYNALFNSQWAPFEKTMVDINEVRPVDFELAKSTAIHILMARTRLSKGGLSNMFIPDTHLKILDIENTTQNILGSKVSVQDMTLFHTAIDQFVETNS